MFSSQAMYNPVLYFFLIGAALPIIIYFAARRWPNSVLRTVCLKEPFRTYQKFLMYIQIHVPIIMGSLAAMPPAVAGNYFPWALIGLGFQCYIRRRWTPWWTKYNYLLSAVLAAGWPLPRFSCSYVWTTQMSSSTGGEIRLQVRL